jgi:hypothetical protein
MVEIPIWQRFFELKKINGVTVERNKGKFILDSFGVTFWGQEFIVFFVNL